MVAWYRSNQLAHENLDDLDDLALAAELDKTHPGAAASLREGLDETLTVLRLDVLPTRALRAALEGHAGTENVGSDGHSDTVTAA
jgi:hypothetical protein